MQKLKAGLSFMALTVMLFGSFAKAAEQAEPGDLKILVFGASGKVGVHIVHEALNRGHQVTAVSRNPSQITLDNEKLSVVQGDLLDPVSVANLVAGQDVIVISVRGRVGKSKDPHDTVAFIGACNVVAALRELGDSAPRLIQVGGSGTLEVKPGVLYADTLPKILLPKYLEVEIAGQILTLQYLRSVTDVDWSYITPPKNFTNGKRTGTYRIGGDQILENSHGRSKISRADFAVAVIDEAESAKHVQQRFSVAY